MTRIDEVEALVEIADGRVTMSADVDADLYFKNYEYQPLSRDEPYAQLKLAGDDVSVNIELDGDALDALAEAVLYPQRSDDE